MRKAVAVAPTTQGDTIRQALQKMAPEFEAALPAHVSAEKFIRVAMTAINQNPDLQQADRRSLFGAIVRLAQAGLLPDGNEAALVIFSSKDRGGEGCVRKVQPMPMVAGLLKLMRQSGEVAWIDAHTVHRNDRFCYRPGLDEVPLFEPDWFGDRGELIGAYAIARLKSGEIVPPEIMSRAQIEKVRKVSRSRDNGPWVHWFEQMALKTVLRRYLKRLPTSADAASAFERDETLALESAAEDGPPTLPGCKPTRLEALEHEIAHEAIAEQGGEQEQEGVEAITPPPASEGEGG